MHRMVTDGTLDNPDGAGRLRRPDEDITVQDVITGEIFHSPPPADELPDRLTALCQFANGSVLGGGVYIAAGSVLISNSTVSFGGTNFATFSGGAGTNTLVVTFTNSTAATVEAAQALVRRLTYKNLAGSVTNLTRTIRLAINDGRSGTNNPLAFMTVNLLYADAGPDMFSPAVRGVPYRIYVPDSGGSTVTVIDPATAKSAGRIPSSYTTALDADGLRGARLGIFLPLFGTAEDDQRAGSVVRTAVRRMEQKGAQIVDVAAPAMPAEGDVSLIRFEFKFHLNAYLAGRPAAPVRSLSEILDKRLFHPALEQPFRRSNDVATLDSDEYRTMAAKQGQLREALLHAMDDHRVVALVYPTLRRTAAKIGEPQSGGNCHASAATGLPAITVPAGFADDGMPVGVELLGRPFAETDLLKLAYAFEQATHHRRPPPLTPQLR